jgi:AcrR family transcriptional regulator
MSQDRAVRPAASRKRSNAADGSRERLLETAERLFADHGIDGVSLRQIAAAAGNGNNSVIQYHFGDKAGLMRQIIVRRVARFEPRRRALLANAEAEGRPDDLRPLLEIIFLPLAEATDSDGRPVYVRFIMEFLTRFQYQEGTEHPGWAPDSAAVRAVALLSKRLPFLSGAHLAQRINRAGGLFFNALIERDNARARGRTTEPEKSFMADLFAMMAAAIAAPIVCEDAGASDR